MSDHLSNSATDADTAIPDGADHSRALMPLAPSAGLPASPLGMDAGPRPRDVIRGGIDPSSLFHSFRRRWLLAMSMGALVGAMSGAALFYFFQESSSAIQLFQVSSNIQSITGSDVGRNETAFDTYRSTQAVLITSQFVLNGALRADGVSQTSFFKDIPEEQRWQHLAEELSVTFPGNSEVMRVSLSGNAPASELRLIVEAVSEAYRDEVLVNDKIERLRPREILIDSLADLNKELQRKSETLENILKDEGKGGLGLEGGRDPETRLLTAKAIDLQRKISEDGEELRKLQSEFSRDRRLMLDPEVLEAQIEESVAGMIETQQLETDVAEIKRQIRLVTSSAQNNPDAQAVLAQLQEQYQFMLAELVRHKEGTKKRMLAEFRRKPNTQLRLLSLEFREQVASLQRRLAQANQELIDLTTLLRERNATTSDIIMRRGEIEGLRSMAESVALQIRQWTIEAEADERIKPLGSETQSGINTTQRYAIAGVGGLGCFALVCFGIAYMEFQNRRLDGPEQVDEGLGIRVIGTLPALSGRKALDPRHPVVAQLTESIDSVRTALVHESTRKQRQIVMVTSAAAMEGRTTVASQLAASLARAGRRTLLIDGDLRRPALHNLFDVPLEDGLCEVLRAETDVADVIRPTHAEGLWLITAGYCDADAVHALATDQVQPIFDKLRSDYDFIIIDGAPVLGLSDSLLFGQHCDGAILSVLRDHTSVPKIHQSSQLLQSVGVKLIGSVVNGVVTKSDRRVTHLQAVAPKSEQKRLEEAQT